MNDITSKIMYLIYLSIAVWFITLPIGADSRADSHLQPMKEPGREFGWMYDKNKSTLYFCLPNADTESEGVMCIPYNRPVTHLDDGHHEEVE